MKNLIKSNSYIIIYFLLPVLILAYSIISQAETQKQAFDSSIIVLAPTSMTNVLNQIARKFSSENNISVTVVYESSTELSRIIEEGEPANIFITEDLAKMTDLQRLGMLNVFNVAHIASDTLVLVVPKENFLKKKIAKFDSFEDKVKFIAKNVSLVIPDPEIDPSGKYIKQVFDKLGLWEMVSNKMLRAANTENALYLIANGNNAGITYYSDTYNNDNVEVLLEIPQNYYDKITYQASIIAELNSENNSQDSLKFLNFLKQEAIRKIFTDRGFRDI